MANYTTANLVKAQVKLQGAFASQDTRFRDPAVHKLFVRNTAQLVPNYKELRTREDRTVETNYFKRTSRALGSARAHNHTGTKGDSGILTPTWATKADDFYTTLKSPDNKIYEAQEIFENELFNSIANFMEGLETVASNTLFNNRTGVNTATSEGTFDATNAVFEITDSTHGNRAIQISKMVMDINKYQGVKLNIVCDSIAFNKFQYLAAQGISNATNYSFQFMGVDFIHDPKLTALAVALDATYTKGYWEVVPDMTVACLDWIPKQNRMGVETKENLYGSIMNPFDGLQYAVHSYVERTDDSANGGYTQDVATQVEVSIDVAYELAPLSTATETVVYAFALV